MPRVERTLDLPESTWEYLDKISLALGHDELEETLLLLVELGVKAVSITSEQNRTIKMLSGERQYRGEPCKTCGMQRILYGQEVAVTLGIDDRRKAQGQPVYDEDS